MSDHRIISRRRMAGALAASATLMTGCGGGPRHASTEKFFLVVANTKLPYWQGANDGLNAAARSLKVQAMMTGPEAYTPQDEVAEFRSVVAAKPAGILVSAANPNLFKTEIDSAIASGIPVVTIDSDVPDSNRLCFIGTDNYAAGQLGGQRLLKDSGGRGKFVVYTMPEQANLADRLRGYRDAFAGKPIELEVIDAKGDPTLVFDSTREILEKRSSQVDGFICLVSLAAPEVVEQLQRTRQKKLVMGMDAHPKTIEGVKSGIVHATIVQKPYTMAFTGARMLADLNLYGPADWKDSRSTVKAPVPRFIDCGIVVVDRSNVENYGAAS